MWVRDTARGGVLGLGLQWTSGTCLFAAPPERPEPGVGAEIVIAQARDRRRRRGRGRVKAPRAVKGAMVGATCMVVGATCMVAGATCVCIAGF